MVTLVVLMALTVVAVAVTNSNQSQSIMVRNNQFRLETFNVSYSELDAQIDTINKRSLAQGIPAKLIKLVDGVKGDRLWDTAPNEADRIPLLSVTDTNYMDRAVAQEKHGRCKDFGEQMGVGSEIVKCDEIKVESDADLKNTSVSSEQRQVYEYRSLAVQ